MNTMTAEETMTVAEVAELVEVIGEEMALEIGKEILEADQVAALAALTYLDAEEVEVGALWEWLREVSGNGAAVVANENALKFLEAMGLDVFRFQGRWAGGCIVRDSKFGKVQIVPVTGGGDAHFLGAFYVGGTNWPDFFSYDYQPLTVGIPVKIPRVGLVPVGAVGISVDVVSS